VGGPRFQTRDILEFHDFAALSAALLLRRRGGRLARVMRRVTAWTIAGLLWIFTIIVFFRLVISTNGGVLEARSGAEMIFQILVIIALGMLGLWFARSWDGGLGKFSPRKAWDRYADKGRAITYAFYDDGYVQSIGGDAPHSPYTEILALAEDDGHFYLLTSPRTGHIIGKNAFQVGNSADFAAFVEQKIADNSQS
jgi:hypothetical protein